MNSIMCFFFISLLMCFLIMIMLLMLSKKSLVDLQKSSPFECGFNPISSKRLPFSIHFFLIAVLFLIFDIEIIIILPLVITVNYGFIVSWLMSSTLFLFILILGLYYEWSDGMLNWSN